jgi:hypothetical protein
MILGVGEGMITKAKRNMLCKICGTEETDNPDEICENT